MAKFYDLELIALGDALIASALGKDPYVFDRLTDTGIKSAMSDDKTVLVTFRVAKPLLDSFDAVIRERAYREGKRVTRNSVIVELIKSVAQEPSPPEAQP
mgnify:CR=1 FL=1